MPSTVVDRMRYDEESSTLRIFYVSGSIYDYLKVPREVYLQMKRALSKGTFLNKHIKGHYTFKKIADS